MNMQEGHPVVMKTDTKFGEFMIHVHTSEEDDYFDEENFDQIKSQAKTNKNQKNQVLIKKKKLTLAEKIANWEEVEENYPTPVYRPPKDRGIIALFTPKWSQRTKEI